MKKFLVLIFFVTFINIFAKQTTVQNEKNVTVYFINSSFNPDFSYENMFDNDKFIGRINSGKYFIYKCKPGKHLFLIKFNVGTTFFEADFDKNHIYVILINQKYDFISKVQKFIVVDKKFIRKNKALFKRIIRTINKKKPYNLSKEKIAKFQKKFKKYIKFALKQYKMVKKNKPSTISILKKDQYLEPNDLIYKK